MSWRPTRPSMVHCPQLTAEFPCGGTGYGTGMGILVFASNGGKRAVPLSRSHEIPVMERRSFAISSLMNWVARLSLYLVPREFSATFTFPFPELSGGNWGRNLRFVDTGHREREFTRSFGRDHVDRHLRSRIAGERSAHYDRQSTQGLGVPVGMP